LGQWQRIDAVHRDDGIKRMLESSTTHRRDTGATEPGYQPDWYSLKSERACWYLSAQAQSGREKSREKGLEGRNAPTGAIGQAPSQVASFGKQGSRGYRNEF